MTNTLSGKIVLAVLAALAEAYLDNLSEETSKGKRARVENGLPNGNLPYGYRNPDEGTDGSGRGINNAAIAIVVPEQAAVVRLAFDLYASGRHSHSSVARALNQRGYRMVSKAPSRGLPLRQGHHSSPASQSFLYRPGAPRRYPAARQA